MRGDRLSYGNLEALEKFWPKEVFGEMIDSPDYFEDSGANFFHVTGKLVDILTKTGKYLLL